MTTEITKLHNAKLPPLPAYRSHLDKRLPDPEPSRAADIVICCMVGGLMGTLYALFF